MDEHNLKIFIICTHSVAGALPMAIIITSDEQYDTIRLAFSTWVELMGGNFFFGQGSPSVFMTDNCDELRRVLKELFPLALLLLCQFHILQQVWRWLFDSKHGVTANDRPVIMKLFRQLVNCAGSKEEFDTLANTFIANACLNKYLGAVEYFTELSKYGGI